MIHVLEPLLATGGPLAAQSYSDSEGGSWLLWLLGPAAGVLFYIGMFLRYRNTNKRHAYERETSAEVVDMRVYDQVVGNVTGVQRTSIEGANGTSPRSRLGRGTTVTVAAAPAPPLPPEVQAQQPPQPQQPQTPAPEFQAPPAPPLPPEAGPPPVQPPTPPQQPPAQG